jgi:hypothetical protein
MEKGVAPVHLLLLDDDFIIPDSVDYTSVIRPVFFETKDGFMRGAKYVK